MLDVVIPKQKSTRAADTKAINKLLRWVVLLNAGVWAFVFIYLELFPPTFVSRGGMRILGGEPGIDVSLPNSGRAAPYPISERPKEFQNPKKDYVYIASSSNVLEEAAAKLGITVKKFGKPKITADEETAIIAFEVQGKSPEQAREKAQILYRTVIHQIEKLRNNELERREKEIKAALQQATLQLDASRKRLASYQARSSFKSPEQITNLSISIEQLRRQRAELLARQQDVNKRLQELSKNSNLLLPQASDAYKLQADEVYKQYLKQYAEHSTALATLSSRFTPESPQIVREKIALQRISNAMQQRGDRILGKSVSLEEQMRLATTTLDPQVGVTREEVSKNLVSNRIDQSGLGAQIQELDVQIDQMEKRLKVLTQEQFTADKLERELQLAETSFASTAAKLNLRNDNIYSIYPPVQLVVEPNLPKPNEPLTPSPQVAYLTGLAGSFIVTTGLILRWVDKKRKPSEESPAWSDSVNEL